MFDSRPIEFEKVAQNLNTSRCKGMLDSNSTMLLLITSLVREFHAQGL